MFYDDKKFDYQISKYALNNKFLKEYMCASKLLTDWGVLCLLKSFQEENLFINANKISIDEIKKQLKITDFYMPLLNALLELLHRYNYISLSELDNYILSYHKLVAWDMLNFEKEIIIKQYPCIKVDANFLQIVIASYVKCLRGEESFLNIMFPNGSFKVIEQIYKNNPDSIYYNQLTALIANSFSECKKSKKSIIEIGAGVGSISSSLLPILKLNNSCYDYIYTDISRAFIEYGKNLFFTDYNFLTFKTLNIEKNPISQGFQSNHYDIAIASNVIHT
ncbi:MAG: class I SAM-dependent methyltransferase, partial [Gammaproteobacteria bacterium]